MFLGIIFVIIFLSILIVVHELGHFLAARKFGLWVEEFGFGLPSKKLWSKKIGETIYSINLLPFGGFVKIFGEDRSENNLSEITPKISEKIIEPDLSYKLNGIFFKIRKEYGRYYREKQYGDILEKYLKEEKLDYKREVPISLEDKYSNFIDFIIEDKILIEIKSKPIVSKNDYFQVRRYLELTGLELGLLVNFREIKLKPMRILNAKLNMKKSFRIISDNNSRSFSHLLIWQRAIIISSGVIFNFILGWLIMSFIFFIGVPKAILITDIAPNSPAFEIGLKPGDKIIGFENSENAIRFINENRGKETEIKIERDKKILNFKAVPREKPPAGQGALGINLTEVGFEKRNLLTSFWEGLKTSFELSVMIFKAIFELIIKAVSGQGSFDSISGPVGIIKITSQAGQLGFIYLFQLLALISLNLAALNIFPFPALDGGRLIFLMIEKIKGSPVKPKIEQIINSLGLIFLMALMIIITIKDIAKF